MIKTLVLCDVCERPLPIEDGNTVKLHRTKEWDTRILFPHLCECCALKIDNALLKMKEGVTYKREILNRNAKINEERRKKLNSKG